MDNKLYAKEWRKRNPSKIKEARFLRETRYLKTWGGFIPKEDKCGICQEIITFNGKDGIKAIHFDHRYGGAETIKGSPFSWLTKHKRTSKTEEIWNSCNFGKLCFKHNVSLPTIDREDYVIKLVGYVFGDKIKEILIDSIANAKKG